MKTRTKVANIIERDGLLELIPKGLEFAYKKTIREYLPYRIGSYNGVEVPSYRYLDPIFIQGLDKDRPEYEKGIVNAMNDLIEKGDKITIVGGGVGVTTVKACRLSGEESDITVYEGSENQIGKMKKSFNVNKVDPKIKHGIVGPNIDIWDEGQNPPRIDPKDLEECDLLELDCEGSEIRVLEEMNITPQKIIVESHGFQDSGTGEVKEKLRDLSYSIKNVELAEDIQFCKENDVKVISAEKS